MTMPNFLNACWYLLDRRLEAGEGDRVALEQRVPLVMLDGVDWVASFLAALRIGAVPVPMSTMLTGAELAFQCNDARARVAIASGALGPAVKEMVTACDELEDLVVAGGGETEVGVGGVRVHGFDAWAGGQPTEVAPYAT